MKRPSILVLAAVLISCRDQPKRTVTVAAAANLADVFQQLGPPFEAQTGIHPVFSFASTAQLALQIENSAPFDVFTAADTAHVAEMDRKGLLVSGSRAIYARGVLALWIPSGAAKHIEDLKLPAVRIIAIAKPELAPYGQAAVETLQRLGLWGSVEPKVVYAENISMAKQYGKSNNADAVFTAYSLVLHESGTIIQIDESLHQPLNQELGILSKSNKQDAARSFVAFLRTGQGKPILQSYGYLLP